MTRNPSEWVDAFLNLLSLASRLEEEGEYNIAKLARAAADSLGREAAYQARPAMEADQLAVGIRQTAASLSHLGVSPALLAALENGAATLAAGRVSLIGDAPHPSVCRTCGHLALTTPQTKCPTCGAWPDTYQRFMPNYWFDALEPFAALESLRRTPEEAAALLTGLAEETMARLPTEGGWAIRNVITHLRDAQQLFDFRLDLFLQEEHPDLEAKAVWTWATQEEERPPTASEIFAAYRAARAQSLGKLEQLPLADWWRTGRHQEFGEVTLRQQVSYFAAHEVTHLPQIESLRHRWMESETHPRAA